MANFKVNQYDKSRELFNRATKVIPSGVYVTSALLKVTSFP